MIQIKDILRSSIHGLLNSYAQVFFSKNRVFAFLLCAITFIDPTMGAMGFLAIVVIQIIAWSMGFDKGAISDGTYTYNPLMVGLALGASYELNASLLFVLVVLVSLTFLISVWFIRRLGTLGLPLLSIPFLIGVWAMILGAGNFTALELCNRTKILSDSHWLLQYVNGTVSDLPLSNVIHLYLRSLGAVIFQYNDLAGLLIAVGLLLNSRISFVLSIFGFSIGYAFYYYLEGDFAQLIYSYIGFNFILTSIALGGVFLVPSRTSFLLLVLIIPMIAVLISAVHGLFQTFQLPLYSLPFNIIVILFLSAMQYRVSSPGVSLVVFQQLSPEKHHYGFLHSQDRFRENTFVHVGFPVIGEWNISQGYDGGVTHVGEWGKALDFDVRDEDGSSYHMPGFNLEDYHCYDLPVIAPADGTVIEIVDGVPDNEIGKVNLQENWGNTIVIQHGVQLYSKISHFKEGSFKVKKGDVVRKGDILGKCGSSGRSPEPHLHFQMQTTPFIGSKTLYYPVSYYVSNRHGRVKFHSFEIPEEGDRISNLRTTRLLVDAFGFVPGKKITIREHGIEGREEWEVCITPSNQAYLKCLKSGATAWFVINNSVFYFTEFLGDRTGLLYEFYLAAYKVPLGFYEQMELRDPMNIIHVTPGFWRSIHDLTAPFFHYISTGYQMKFNEVDNEHEPIRLTFESSVWIKVLGRLVRENQYSFEINEESLLFRKKEGGKERVFICE